MATSRNNSNSYWNNAQNKKEFCNGLIETVSISVNGFYGFFQQGNDTHNVLHIIYNIELKLDFANLKIAISVKKNKK